MFTNIGKDRHSAWVDEEHKERETHARLDVIVSALIFHSRGSELVYLNEVNEAEVVQRLQRVHSNQMIQAIKQASLSCKQDQTTVTSFDLESSATYAPIDVETYYSALYSAQSAIRAAEALREGKKITFSLSRPPGHHSGRNFYHGFCYFNNAAVAAEVLREGNKKVAILDIDVHHGDGTQDIFYRDSGVFFTSLHADPNVILPNTGRTEEKGADTGSGTTLNLPLAIGISAGDYKKKLITAVNAIQNFHPTYLVLSAGFDTHKLEKKNLPPLTQLDTEDYFDLGEIISEARIPTCVILEGGYNTEVLGDAFIELLRGLEMQQEHDSQ